MYCACGKEVKYQYVLRSKKSQQKIGLSLQHLSDHINIPLSIARNIKAGIQGIDRHLDKFVYKLNNNRNKISS